MMRNRGLGQAQLQDALNQTNHNINRLRLGNAQRQNNILKRTLAMQGGAQGPARGKLPFWLAPGNVGDLNMMIWPFFFTTDYCEVAPGTSISNGITITQEAAFVVTEISKTVFLKQPDPLNPGQFQFLYIDPNDPRDLGFAPGLSLFIKDSTSSRNFVGPFGSFNIDALGGPDCPSVLPAPQMIMPNANLQVNFSLKPTYDATYVPFVTFFGYKMRISELNETGRQRTLAYDPSGAFDTIGG